MALSDIALCSRALIRLGANPISSFSDGSAEAEIAGALYGPARDGLLSAHPWNFATSQVALNQLQEAPLADYSYAFQLPNDFLRALSAGSGIRGRGLTYRIFGGTLHTNATEVLLTYIYQVDEASFPPFFDMALIAHLTAEFCIPLTENTSRASLYFDLAEDQYKRAKQVDSQQDTPKSIDDFSLVDVRG